MQPLSLWDEYVYGVIFESERLDSRGKATQVPPWISWHDSWHWRPWPCRLCALTPTQTLLAKSNPMPLPVCYPSPSQNIPEGTIYLLVSVRPRSGFPPLSLVQLQRRHGTEPKYDDLIVHAKINRNTKKIHFTSLIYQTLSTMLDSLQRSYKENRGYYSSLRIGGSWQLITCLVCLYGDGCSPDC